MVVKIAHFSAAAIIARPKNQEAAGPSETLTAGKLSSAAEPLPGLPAAKKHKQAQPLLMSIHGKHNAPETWPESCSGGMVYDEAVDIWAFGWLFRP